MVINKPNFKKKQQTQALITKLINEKNESLISHVEICNNLNSNFTNIAPKKASKILDTKTPNTISSLANSFLLIVLHRR